MKQVAVTRILLLAVLSLLIAESTSRAQSEGRYFQGGGPFTPGGGALRANENKRIPCLWFYFYDPPDRYLEANAVLWANGKSYSAWGHGLGGSLLVGVSLDGTYVPSDSVTCGSGGSVDRPQYIFEWWSAYGNWTNSTCEGMAGAESGRTPTNGVSYAFAANVVSSDWDNMRLGFFNGGSYWPSVGGSASVNNPMFTPIGGDRIVTADPTLPPEVAARHDYPSGSFLVNPAYKSRPQSFWAVVGAHELGHALNSSHAASSDFGRSIMAPGIAPDAAGLTPRDLDKCWIVRYLQPDIVVERLP